MKDDLIKRSDAIGAFVAETNGVNVEEAINVVDAYLQIRECDEVWDSIRAIRDCLECAKDDIAEFVPSADTPHSDDWERYSDRLWKNAYERGKADRPQKVVAQITFDEEKLREIVKEAVERFKEEYEITDRPQGEWIRTGRTNIYGGIEVQCSNCGDRVMVQHLEDEWYCRHCGADMGMKGTDDDI